MNLHRRTTLIGLGALALAAAGLAGCSSAPGELSISQHDLQRKLDAQFPRSYPLAGVLQLQLQSPRLTLLPETNRLRAVSELQASSPLLGERTYQGALDVEFGLRWEPSDHTVRARDLFLHALTIDGLPASLAKLAQGAGALLMQAVLEDGVLYQLPEKDIERLRRMRVQPGAITVTQHGLVLQVEPTQ